MRTYVQLIDRVLNQLASRLRRDVHQSHDTGSQHVAVLATTSSTAGNLHSSLILLTLTVASSYQKRQRYDLIAVLKIPFVLISHWH